MLVKSAIIYYLSSIPTLITNFNWWVFPLVFFKKPILVRIKNNPSFYVSNFMDIWTLKETIVDTQYEQNKKIQNGDVVIDIGAVIGDFSIYVSKKANKVFAYECDDERVFLMRKNLHANRIKNVALKHVKAESLKQIMVGVDKCDFFKIDCEGGEYEIFKNAEKSVLSKIRYIAMEAHKFNKEMESEFENLLNNLKINNFEVKIIPNSVHEYICFVFAHKKN